MSGQAGSHYFVHPRNTKIERWTEGVSLAVPVLACRPYGPRLQRALVLMAAERKRTKVLWVRFRDTPLTMRFAVLH
jgi:hypothetical protein